MHAAIGVQEYSWEYADEEEAMAASAAADKRCAACIRVLVAAGANKDAKSTNVRVTSESIV